MPMGAVVVVDYYLLKRFGLQSDYAEYSGSSFNIAAAVAWGAALVLSLLLNRLAGVQIYFLALPGWLTAGLLFLVVSTLTQHRSRLVVPEGGR